MLLYPPCERGARRPGGYALFPCSTGAWVPPLSRAERALWRTLMKFREPAKEKRGGKAGVRHMAMTSAAPKRIAATKKSAPAKKASPAKKSAVPAKKAAAPPKKAAAMAKKAPAAKKPAAVPRKETPPAKSPAPPPAAPRPATPLPGAQAQTSAPRPAAPAARPNPSAPARPAPMSSQSAEERRKAVTRKFFARLRSLEAIIGADLRKRGSVVLMQAVDQWYSEAISATGTDVSITNAAKVVIAHLGQRQAPRRLLRRQLLEQRDP